MTTQLKDARILLSGASRGVGYATARLLIEEGAHVLGIARDEPRLTEASAKLAGHGPGTFTSLCIDLGSTDAAARIASHVEEL